MLRVHLLHSLLLGQTTLPSPLPARTSFDRPDPSLDFRWRQALFSNHFDYNCKGDLTLEDTPTISLGMYGKACNMSKVSTLLSNKYSRSPSTLVFLPLAN